MIVNSASFLQDILNRVLREDWTPVQAWELRLYVNDYTPLCTSVPADFTEASFGGYGRRDVLPENWQAPTVDGCVAESLYGSSPMSWTCSADPEDVYGYWIQDTFADRVVFAERLVAVAELAVGTQLFVRPRYKLADFVVCP